MSFSIALSNMYDIMVPEMILEVRNESEMKSFGARLGALLRGGEVLELTGDVGAGKTTLTKGIGLGLGVDEDVQSPSFTISRVYDTASNIRLFHYDFYRLHDAGIMASELHDTLRDPSAVTIIEWADIVGGILPDDRLTIHITPISETGRRLELNASGEKARGLAEKLV